MTGKLFPAIFLLVTLCVFCGCAGDKNDEGSEASTGGPDELLIAGTWVRLIRGQDERLEGLWLDAEHRFGLLGIHTMHGLEWAVTADTLVLTTNTGRYPEPFESRLVIEIVDEKTLTLSGTDYLAGTYNRNADASGGVTGTVAYRQRIALPPNAAVHLTLESKTGGFVAAQTIPSAGRQVPIPFHMCYLASDVDSEKTYELEALIVAGDKRMFHTAEGVPVITQGHPVNVEVMMTPFSGAKKGVQESSKDKAKSFRINGMFVYMADAGLFTDCRTGERFPVAQKGDNAALERAYLSTRKEPAEPLYVTIEGHFSLEPKMEGDGKQMAIIVDKFLSISADGECPDDSTATPEHTGL